MQHCAGSCSSPAPSVRLRTLLLWKLMTGHTSKLPSLAATRTRDCVQTTALWTLNSRPRHIYFRSLYFPEPMSWASSGRAKVVGNMLLGEHFDVNACLNRTKCEVGKGTGPGPGLELYSVTCAGAQGVVDRSAMASNLSRVEDLKFYATYGRPALTKILPPPCAPSLLRPLSAPGQQGDRHPPTRAPMIASSCTTYSKQECLA